MHAAACLKKFPAEHLVFGSNFQDNWHHVIDELECNWVRNDFDLQHLPSCIFLVHDVICLITIMPHCKFCSAPIELSGACENLQTGNTFFLLERLPMVSAATKFRWQ
jgi:hypothetical protein